MDTFRCRFCDETYVVVISPPTFPSGRVGTYEARHLEWDGSYTADNSVSAHYVSRSTVARLRRNHEEYCFRVQLDTALAGRG